MRSCDPGIYIIMSAGGAPLARSEAHAVAGRRGSAADRTTAGSAEFGADGPAGPDRRGRSGSPSSEHCVDEAGRTGGVRLNESSRAARLMCSASCGLRGRALGALVCGLALSDRWCTSLFGAARSAS